MRWPLDHARTDRLPHPFDLCGRRGGAKFTPSNRVILVEVGFDCVRRAQRQKQADRSTTRAAFDQTDLEAVILVEQARDQFALRGGATGQADPIDPEDDPEA